MLSYKVKTGQFEGALDALLDLIEDRQLSINEISLAEVSTQYLDYVKSLSDLPRSEAASFLVVASTLMLIKSKSLLPSLELTEEEQESIEDLERRLEFYKRIKEMSQRLNYLYGKNVILSREAFSGVSLGFVEPQGVSTLTLKDALSGLIKSLPVKEDLPEKMIAKVIKLEDKINELHERVSRALKTSFTEFIGSGKDKMNLVVSFLALLELMKQGLLVARQEGIFCDIEISKQA